MLLLIGLETKVLLGRLPGDDVGSLLWCLTWDHFCCVFLAQRLPSVFLFDPGHEAPPERILRLLNLSWHWDHVVSVPTARLAEICSLTQSLQLSGHYSRDWSESVNVIGAISEPFARDFR